MGTKPLRVLLHPNLPNKAGFSWKRHNHLHVFLPISAHWDFLPLSLQFGAQTMGQWDNGPTPLRCHHHPLPRGDNINILATNPQQIRGEQWEVQVRAVQAEHGRDTSVVMVATLPASPVTKYLHQHWRRAANHPDQLAQVCFRAHSSLWHFVEAI